MREAIRSLVEAGGTVAVAYENLETGEAWAILPDRVFHAASTMKVGVMIEVYRQAARGRFSLDDSLVLANDFVSIADGSRYSVGREDDADPGLHEMIGAPVPIRELTRRMVTRSGNLATNALVELVSADAVSESMRALGAPGVRILRGVEDGPAYARGMNNTTTAEGLRRILAKLARHEVVSESASEEMLEILLAQEHNEGVPARLPPQTRVAHKTGWTSAVYHDAGIVYPVTGSAFVLVVLTEGFPDLDSASTLVAEVAFRLVSR